MTFEKKTINDGRTQSEFEASRPLTHPNGGVAFMEREITRRHAIGTAGKVAVAAAAAAIVSGGGVAAYFSTLPTRVMTATVTNTFTQTLTAKPTYEKLSVTPRWGFTTGLGQVPIKIIQQLNLPQKYGLDINWLAYSNFATKNSAFAAQGHDIDSGVNPQSVANLYSQGQKVTVACASALMGAVQSDPSAPYANNLLFVKKGSPIKTIADLKGKTIGVPTPIENTGWAPVVFQAFKDAGLDWNSDVKIAIGAAPLLPTKLDAGDIDAMFLVEFNTCIKTLATGNYTVLFDPDKAWIYQTGESVVISSMAMQTPFIQANTEAAKRVILMWIEAVNYIRSNPNDPTLKSIATDLGFPPEAYPTLVNYGYNSLSYAWDAQLITSVKRMIQLNVNYGVYKSVPADNGWYTTTLLPQ